MFLSRKIQETRLFLRSSALSAQEIEQRLSDLEAQVEAFEKGEPGCAEDPDESTKREETREMLGQVVEDWFRRETAQLNARRETQSQKKPKEKRRIAHTRLKECATLLLRLRALRSSSPDSGEPRPLPEAIAQLLAAPTADRKQAEVIQKQAQTTPEAPAFVDMDAGPLSIARRAERLIPAHRIAVVGFYTRGWRSLEGLRSVRADWDSYLVQEGGSRVPGHWPSDSVALQ